MAIPAEHRVMWYCNVTEYRCDATVQEYFVLKHSKTFQYGMNNGFAQDKSVMLCLLIVAPFTNTV